MSKKLFKTFSWRKFIKYLSGAATSVKMVRYFTNPYEDYKPNTAVAVNKSDVVRQINDHIANIVKRVQPSRKTIDGGLYVGTTGIAFMFYRLSKNPLLSDSKASYISKAMEYLQPALEASTGEKTSFLLGDAGTYAIAAVLLKEMGNDQYSDYVKNYKSLFAQYLNPKFLKCGGDEFFVGRAGYLAGALWIARELKTNFISNSDFYKICDVIVDSGREYSKLHHSTPPLMYHYYNTEYLGAAHGISFILQVLLSVPGYLEFSPVANKEIKTTIDYVLSLQTEEGNWPCCMEEVNLTDHKLVHWCHGAPGMIYLMAKAYLIYKEQKYLNSCISAGEVVWHKGLLMKGPGICHGVAGNGYVFLLLHRLTGDEKYLYRAMQFAEFLVTDEFQRDARLPDNPQSLYEGTAGTVCYLSDLLVPDTAEFPFQDVF